MFASGKTAAVASAANYIEDVFSTYLYTGTGASQTITNGIDLSTKGGMIWTKDRNTARNNVVYDTTRGLSKRLVTNTTDAQTTATVFSTLTTTSYNVDWPGTSANETNANGETYASWTFRKQAKFFDVVTFNGNATARTIAHNLGSVPGCIMVKCTTEATDWWVYHRSLGTNQVIKLNTTAAKDTSSTAWNNTAPTSTVFSIGDDGQVNSNGQTYVAYLFAHDAGGFGLTGADNVISCGSMDGAAGTTVTLGYEPQFVMYKAATTTGNWIIADTMRGFTANGSVVPLRANLSDAETAGVSIIAPNATGFSVTGNLTSGQTYIYIAIRRGPMKVPTSGTSVFDIQTYTGTQVARTITTANTVDLSYTKSRDTAGTRWNWTDRLRGATKTIDSSLTAAEASDTTGYTSFAVQKGYTLGTGDTYDVNTSGRTYASWNLTRAPGFFDEVCYTGTGSAGTTQKHNLGVVPELVILKQRSAVNQWIVMSGYLNAGVDPWSYKLVLNLTESRTAAFGQFNGTAPTSTQFTLGSDSEVNDSGGTYVAYLFATCAGVSKVGTYTGTGATQTINCGFSGGARFVLIKNAESTGDWYVWDTARGIVSGNDPYLLLNSTAAEVTNTDYIDTYSAGFEISSTAPAAINASGGTFIFLAIA